MPASIQTSSRARPIKFFRISLTSLTADEIQAKLVRLDNEVKEFKQELFRISWYMRGGVTVQELLTIYSMEDREMIYNVIKDNIEATKETRMPLL
jgi:uncharacterized protein YcfL